MINNHFSSFLGRRCLAAAVLLLIWVLPAAAQTAPPAPTLVAPSNGAAVIQPFTLDWNPVVDPDGSIGSYTWQIGTTSSFTTVVLAGFTNNLSDSIPTPTEDKVSGLPNGTYFWRVKASQTVGGATGSIESPWSPVRNFTVNGLGAAPGIPMFVAPANGARFHVSETFNVKWSAVPGAHYYLLEVDDSPNFSYPLALTTTALTFGTQSISGWGNAIPNAYYRVRAVSVDNVRGLPSATLNVQITNAAPVPSAPQLVAPAVGATVSLPFTFDWSDAANPQVQGYDLDVDTDPNFGGSFGVLLLQGLNRSDYMVASDLPPGRYFWRVRARQGDGVGPWSAGRAITMTTAPATPPDLGLFTIIATPGNGFGTPTQARVLLNQPAPQGGALVTIASDIAAAQTPGSVFIPAGKTDAMAAPITTTPYPPNGIVGTIRAAYGGGWQQSSLGVLPLLYGTVLSHESIVGGTSLTGAVVLQSAAPPGGATIHLISSDTSLVRPPATVFVPAGGTDATFTVATSPVASNSRVVIETGTDNDGYRAPQNAIVLTPFGSIASPPTLSSVTLNPQTVAAGSTAIGTVTLTAPAPAGGAVILLNGSMEGQVITPSSVTVPSGSLSADFAITAPQVVASQWVMIQARYGLAGRSLARALQINPGPPGTPTLLAFNARSQEVFGGKSLRGTVGLVTPAPVGGAVVGMTSENPSVLQVPASVNIAAGNSTNSFTMTSAPVSITTSVRVDASAGGETRSWFVYVAPDPNAPPLLQSMTLNPSSVAGGTSAAGTVFLSAPAPAGGITVTLATSNSSVARPPAIVAIAGGQTSANFTVTTFTVTSDTLVNISAFFGNVTRSASFNVTRGFTPPPSADLSAVSLSPASVVGGSSSQGTVTLSSGAPACGAVITLSSSNTAVATAPASVTVASGATSTTFAVATQTVTASTPVTLTASYKSVTRNATLTVNSTSGGSLPAPSMITPSSDARFSTGQNITFDWSDVSGAAGYTLQIDDQESFSSPLINQNVTASQFPTSSLPTTRMWWRVRANSAAGTAGSWSAVRRFEVKN